MIYNRYFKLGTVNSWIQIFLILGATYIILIPNAFIDQEAVLDRLKGNLTFIDRNVATVLLFLMLLLWILVSLVIVIQKKYYKIIFDEIKSKYPGGISDIATESGTIRFSKGKIEKVRRDILGGTKSEPAFWYYIVEVNTNYVFTITSVALPTEIDRDIRASGQLELTGFNPLGYFLG